MKSKTTPEVRAKMKQYILDAIDFSGYDITPVTEREKLEAVWDTFKKEYCHEYNLKYYKTEQKVFENWLMGLPSCFNIDFENYKILELTREWGFLSEKATERQEQTVLDQWWARIFMLFSKLLRMAQHPPKVNPKTIRAQKHAEARRLKRIEELTAFSKLKTDEEKRKFVANLK